MVKPNMKLSVWTLIMILSSLAYGGEKVEASLFGENSGGGPREMSGLIMEAQINIRQGLEYATDEQLLALDPSRSHSLEELRALRDELLDEARCSVDQPLDTGPLGFTSTDGQHSWMYTKYDDCKPILYSQNSDQTKREIPESLPHMERLYRVTRHYLHDLVHHLEVVRQIKVVDLESDRRNEKLTWKYTDLFLPLVSTVYEQILANKIDLDIQIIMEAKGVDPRVMDRVKEGSYTATFKNNPLFTRIRLRKSSNTITLTVTDKAIPILDNYEVTLNCVTSKMRLYCAKTVSYGQDATTVVLDENGYLRISWFEKVRDIDLKRHDNYYLDKEATH